MNLLINGKKYTSSIKVYTKSVLRQCPIMFAVVAVLVMLGFILKRMALFNAITIIVPLIYSSIAVSLYQLGAKKIAGEYLLKYELATMLSKVVGNVDLHYYNNCLIVCTGAAIMAIIVGYCSFIRTEIN